MTHRIVLSTLNARYSHASFGLRYLLANLGPWRARTSLREFTIHQAPLEVVEQLLADDPTVIGFGIYIWNVTETVAVMGLLRALRPDIRLVIGGPEVSYEWEEQEAFRLCDHLIAGEGDLAFRQLLDDLDAGLTPPKLIQAPLPDLASLRLPYDEYSDVDLAQRLLYVEASRGCPYRCEFCLSSLDIPVRAFPLEPFLDALKSLLDRGARAFKFVDRTFNLNLKFSKAILEFCLEHYRPGLELHFEMVPDRLPAELRELLARFPAGAVQLEIGIQSFTPPVLKHISRPMHLERIVDNFRYLRGNTGVHIHADLIFGLPGESLETFEASFNQLLELDPDEIQLGFLKRLRGTPIVRHTDGFALVYSPRPPYEILQNGLVPFETMQRMKRFARYLDLYHNSGDFQACMRLLFGIGSSPGPTSDSSPGPTSDSSPGPTSGASHFQVFLRFADWLYARSAQTHQFALSRLFQELFAYLVEVLELPAEAVARAMLEDWDRRIVRRERLEFLRPYVGSVAPANAMGAPGRQAAPHGGAAGSGVGAGAFGAKKRASQPSSSS